MKSIDGQQHLGATALIDQGGTSEQNLASTGSRHREFARLTAPYHQYESLAVPMPFYRRHPAGTHLTFSASANPQHKTCPYRFLNSLSGPASSNLKGIAADNDQLRSSGRAGGAFGEPTLDYTYPTILYNCAKLAVNFPVLGPSMRYAHDLRKLLGFQAGRS
jgi:hypothetical protein